MITGCTWSSTAPRPRPSTRSGTRSGWGGSRKNRHFFQLERKDYRDKSGKSWDVEIEDLLPWHLLDAFISEYPVAVEERFQRGTVQKVVVLGKPVKRDGETFDYKMMLTEYVRQYATLDDLAGFVAVLKKARKCMRLRKVAR
ncbi:MAG: hypothetical protein ACE5GO_10845 [Anaerolineales bacterium]